MKVWFGKYKGKDIEFLPSSYIKWIAENIDENTPQKKALVEACDKEWQWREKNNEHISNADYGN